MARTPRTGFSLIELLVVIAIISVLAALSAATYLRIRSGQMVAMTESTLEKLNTGLERMVGAERDRADKEFSTGKFPQGVTKDRLMGFAGANENERARALWLFFRLKNEFPQTFPEALSSVTLTGPSGVVFSLPPKALFRGVPNVIPTDINMANLQSAALLYLILSEKGSRGEVFDTDALNAFIVEKDVNGRPMKVFVDTWGTPITFCRSFNCPELNDRPYSKHSLFDINSNASLSNNPIDPSYRLFQVRNDVTPMQTWPNWTFFQSSAGLTQTGVQFRAFNWMPVVVSAGANKTWDNFDIRGASASPHANIGIVTAPTDLKDDNVYGYRLRKFGARGD